MSSGVLVGAYIRKRLLLVIPTFLGMTMVLFFFTRMVPGGPVEQLMMELQGMGHEEFWGGTITSGGSGSVQGSGAGVLSQQQLRDLEAFYGLDKPWYQAYGQWLHSLVRLDLGDSTRYHDPVITMLWERMGVSAYYGIMTFLITYLVCIPLGMAKALRHRTLFDLLTSVVIFLGYAIPTYVVAVMLMVVFGVTWEWFPREGYGGGEVPGGSWIFQEGMHILYHSFLPMLSYLVGSFAVITFHMKSYLMEQMSLDYVRMAVAKGVVYKKVLLRHGLRNSVIPLAGGFGTLLTAFIGGNIFIEKIFNIDGLGLLNYEAALARDYPVVLGSFAVVSVLSLMGNVVSDMAVAIIDPRVSYD